MYSVCLVLSIGKESDVRVISARVAGKLWRYGILPGWNATVTEEGRTFMDLNGREKKNMRKTRQQFARRTE